MSPHVEMVCGVCQEITVVKEILFRTDGLIEVQCFKCGHAQSYGVKN